MTGRRPSPPKPPQAPFLDLDETPELSGEFRVQSGRRASFANIAAVRPAEHRAPLSSGHTLDDSLSFELDSEVPCAIEIELECMPSSHGIRQATSRQSKPDSSEVRATPITTPRMAAAARASAPKFAEQDTYAALIAFAGFGEPPTRLWASPAYAIRVTTRTRILKSDLAHARQHRRADIGLYEASLRTADTAAVRNGFMVMGAVAAFGILAVVAIIAVLSALFGAAA